MIQKIEPAAAIRLLDAKKAQAVDVREPDEYAVGHIPGAKLLPLCLLYTSVCPQLRSPSAPPVLRSASARSMRRCPRCCWAPALS